MDALREYSSYDKDDSNGEYERRKLLTLRFELMKKLSRLKKELDSFLEQYTCYSAIRKLRIQRLLGDGKTDDAILL